ncbi:MAG TPA: glutamate--tRNA ligase [Candidatus Methylomirabilis sp.]|nr:glutamate--tRNA ligase [Candidatus Methylomirabilis sp.]
MTHGKVRVRFAPSPTGTLHVGGARTALYNWLFARHHGGTFILRIEDTDVERSTEESVQAILESLSWLGLTWDEGPIRQADRMALYRAAAERLVREGRAYWCLCAPEELEARRKEALAAGRSPRYDGRCRDRAHAPGGRPAALRIRTEMEGETVVEDLVHGPVSFQNADLDDFILQRSDGVPTYNFAVVVDDSEMGITHVIRGDDHIPNTPRQIQVYRHLGRPLPKFAHIPLILGADRARLSKRHGAASVMAFREMGYLPEAVVNYLARLGWAYGDQEVFSPEELIRHFTLEKVGNAAAVFDQGKLDWLNAHYLRVADPARLADLLPEHWGQAGVSAEAVATTEPSWRVAVVVAFRERAKTLRELAESSRFLFDVPVPMDPEAVAKHHTPEAIALLGELLPRLEVLPAFTADALEACYRGFADEKGIKLGVVAQATRVALTGRSVSPPLFEIMPLLGRDRALARLRALLSAKNPLGPPARSL